MATVQQLKTQIENANALGRTNLAEKGVELSETATTYEIMSKIADVTSSDKAGLPLEITSSCESPFLLQQTNIASSLKYIFPKTTASIQKVGGSVKPYILSSGTQWIDTGYVPKANTKIVLRYARNSTQSKESIFGTNWALNSFFLMHYQRNLRWHGKTASVDIPESSLADFRDVSVYGTNITVNGTSYTVSGNGNVTQSDTLRVFGVRGNTYSQPLGKLKLYELKIYEYNSNTDSFDLVRNYKPKQSQEIGHENEACLYDDVTGAYFYNQGTGSFTYGEESNLETEINVGDEVEIKIDTANSYATFNYQWQKLQNNAYVNIIDATSSTYTAQTGDNAVRCILTGIGNSEGIITSQSVTVNEVD